MNVYDILNAGPNRRFTVRGADGQPFVVSNCVQALAAEIIKEQLLDVLNLCNLPVYMVTHDELVVGVDEGYAEEQMAAVKRVMTQPIRWFPSLPLACEAHYAWRYGEAK